MDAILPRVVLITGGGRGIGRSIAARFSEDHSVAITYRNTIPSGLSKQQLAVKADLRDAESPTAIIDAVIARFGRLDVIVNNAGTIEPSGPEEYPIAGLRGMFEVNLLAVQGLLAAALPHLLPGASVVSISSVNAVLPPKGAALFGASKAALEAWTRGMAKELGPRGIRVNAVAPGAVNIAEAPRDRQLTEAFTDATALGRLAEASDIADAVHFLASEKARSITGEVLTVSGGYRL